MRILHAITARGAQTRVAFVRVTGCELTAADVGLAARNPPGKQARNELVN